MLLNLTHYLTAAIIEQMQLILAANTSETGNPLPVTIYRASPAILPGPPPHIWVEASVPATNDETAILGNTVGVDGSGNQAYGGVLWGPLVDFGVRCANAPERDDIFDKLWQAFSGVGINPATGNRWIFDINVNVGVIVADVQNERTATDETTQYGPLFEATASLLITTVAPDSASQGIISAVDINPIVITLYVPMN